MKGTGAGYRSGSVELNPFWLGEAKTEHFDEGTSSRDFARDRRSFRRRRRSGCCSSCGRGLTSFVTAATRCRSPLVGRSDATAACRQRHQTPSSPVSPMKAARGVVESWPVATGPDHQTPRIREICGEFHPSRKSAGGGRWHSCHAAAGQTAPPPAQWRLAENCTPRTTALRKAIARG